MPISALLAPQGTVAPPAAPQGAGIGALLRQLEVDSKPAETPPTTQDAPKQEEPILSIDDAVTRALDQTQEIEAGFVDNPADKGGPTNRGITLSTLQRHTPRATLDDLKSLSPAGARAILTSDYVDEPGLRKLPAYLIPHMVGLSIHAGAEHAIKILQEVAGVKTDGQLGPATVAAAQKLNVDKLRDRIEDFYVGIVKRDPSQVQFLKGWLTRIRSLHEVTGAVVTEPKPPVTNPNVHVVGKVIDVYEGDDGKLYQDVNGKLVLLNEASVP